MSQRIYIAGPMTGLPEFNYPAFNSAAALLLEAGFEVGNPATIPPPNENPTHADWMRAALTMMLTCDGVALLPGWSGSKGAREEYRVAQDAIGMPCFPLRDWLRGETDL